MAAIYFFIWAAFVWSCFLSGLFAENNLCPSACSCLGGYVDCSRMGLIEVPKDLPVWVTDLIIQSNGISSLHPDDFKGLLHLQQIDLSNNEISFINESVFLNVPALSELKINSNKLTELPVLKGNPLLNRLELTHNNIHTINGAVLASLNQLDTLDLSYNDLMDIPNGTFPANLSITKLFLKNNKIFNLETGCFYNLTKLEAVRLNKNKISHLPKDLFVNSTNMRSLDLSKNQLSKLVSLNFKGLENLQVLKLRKNAIHTLEDAVFFGLTNLQNLQLDENNLTTISKWLYGLKNLKDLSVSLNKIVKIEPAVWEYCPQLVTLTLNNNEMVEITAESFKGLTGLKNLQIANNHVEIIQDDAFKQPNNLEELNLNNNVISSTIEDIKEAFTGLSALKRLSLINNKIKTITKQAFRGLDSLEELALDRNNITSIQGNAFESLPQLNKLTFNTSSLFCDCQLSWVPMWLRDNNFERTVVAKCAHPDVLKGRNIFVVDSNEFKCVGHFLKPVIVMHPKSQIVLKGDNITLNCTAASTESQGSPTEFKWKKDNVVLEDVDTVDFATRSQNLTHYVSRLHIKNAEDTDNGRYQCVISNEFGAAYSKRANINVYVFPKFTKRPQNVTAKARTEATLVCAAEGQPKPNISWQKDGGFDHFPAAQERRMRVIPGDDHFYIVDVKAADEGVYSCTAKNDAGTIVANVTLTVLQTPSFARPMEPKVANVGSTAVLECLAQGSPRPKLTWYRDGKPLVLSQRHFFTADDQLLVIVETEVRDAGKYQCEMSNTLGTIRGTSTLTVITGSVGSSRHDGDGGLDDESTTTGIIIIAVVCCVVGTSLVWVIIIYQTRKRQELYSATPTDETTLPGEVPSSGYMSSDKEGSYTHGLPITNIQGYQYHDIQMKESGYESSSGRFRAARSAAIFPSDVDDGENVHRNYDMLVPNGHYVEQSDENSLSSHEYPRSDTDSLKSEVNSIDSSQSSRQQILTTFHPHITASREQIASNRDGMGASRSLSCSGSQTVCDNNTSVDSKQDTGKTQCQVLENSVSSQTGDDLGHQSQQSYSPCDSDTVNLVCRHCGEDYSPRDTAHVCKHNNPPSIPSKPSRLRHGRHKEHTHFDRAQPPGISLSSSDIQNCLVYDDNIPPSPSQLVPCPSVYVRSDYGPQDGIYVPNGSVGAGGAYMPVYHPVNTSCDCHIHYPAPTSHLHPRDQRTHKEHKTIPNSRNQRVNGIVGCVHHHMNGVNPTWHGHAYTLPYMHQVPVTPPRTSSMQQTQHQVLPRYKEHHSLPRQQHSRSHSSSSLKNDQLELSQQPTETV